MGNFYQIGEACHVTGLTPRTLHYYDEIGLLVPSERLAGGQRLYTAADLERIEQIKELKRLLGLSLSEVKRLLDAEDARRRHLAAAEEAPDEPARRAALEQALGVTEAQWRSVQEKVDQLTRFGRKLERHARDLRRLLKSRRDGAHVKAGLPVLQLASRGGPRAEPGTSRNGDAARRGAGRSSRAASPTQAAGGER